jgi:hypothetical protein
MSSPFVRIEEISYLRIVYFRADGSSAIYLGGLRNCLREHGLSLCVLLH